MSHYSPAAAALCSFRLTVLVVLAIWLSPPVGIYGQHLPAHKLIVRCLLRAKCLRGKQEDM